MVANDFTVPDVLPRVQYVATEGQTEFTIPFRFFEGDDVKVLVNGELVDAEDYTIVGDGLNENGTLTFDTGLTADDAVTFYRDTPIERITNFQNSGDWTAQNVNDQLNALTMFIQEVALRANDLAVTLPLSTLLTSVEFPDEGATTNADKIIAWNPAGTNLINGPTVTGVAVLIGISDEVETLAALDTEITVLGALGTEIAALYALDTEITALGLLTTEIAALGALTTEIEALYAQDANITALAAVNTELAALGAIVTEIQAVEAVDAEIVTLAALNTELGVLGALGTEIAALGAIDTELAAIHAALTNINTVATDLAGDDDIGTVAANIADVQSVADALAASIASGISYDSTGRANTDADDVQEAIDDLDTAIAGLTSGGWVPIQTQTVSSAVASVDFTSGIDGTYKAYAIVMSGCVPVSDDVDFWIRTSANGGSSFDSGASNYKYCTIYGRSGSATLSVAQSSGGTEITAGVNGVGNASIEGLNGTLFLFNPSDATKRTQISLDLAYINASGESSVEKVSALRASAAVVDALQVLFSTGNVAAGTFTLYGLAGA